MKKSDFYRYITEFKLSPESSSTSRSDLCVNEVSAPVFTNEFWTSQQRQAHSIHEVSYRACFKPQLPQFFIHLFTREGETVYDPFNGRGTTSVQAALMQRKVIANDVNPLSLILTRPRIVPVTLPEIQQRLNEISLNKNLLADIDLSAFFEKQTLGELVSLRKYLITKAADNTEDNVDRWIRMVATNRLTGHSKGFFSVFTLPPNQAVSIERQKKINEQRKQQPEYRDVKQLILKKSKVLLRDVVSRQAVEALYCNTDAAETTAIGNNVVALTVTSPPFLDVVQYAKDNWLRCWFNGIDVAEVETKITMSKTVEKWSAKMQTVFNELFRITKPGGIVAFEVGEVRNGKVRLEEAVVPLGIHAGFECDAIIINQQDFTKTANIWGVNNNKAGTNSNRIVVFRKPSYYTAT